MIAGLCLAQALTPAGAHDGDINSDGDVDLVDLLWGQQALQGIRNLTPQEEIQGDVAPLVSGAPQPDGLFNLGDLVVIQRMLFEGFDLSLPGNQFNIGDSIGEGEAANGTIGQPHHETVWSTGYNGGDSVSAFNERFEAATAPDYYENNASRDPVFNHAVSGFVGGTDRVMPGWNEGVIGMQQGGKRLLMLPPALGYGSRGAQDAVPPGSSLIFVIDLVELEKR